jgi:uncharacterized iron-regulated membrane protein
VKVHTHLLRVLHKWIGLLIGVQFLIWTISGAGMALIDMGAVGGGARPEPAPVHLSASDGWPKAQTELAGVAVKSVSLRPLLNRYVYDIETPAGTVLFDATSGQRVHIDASAARRIATAAYPGDGAVKAVTSLDRLTPAVREHELPIWRVDFNDPQNSSFYVSGSNGTLLERRNDSWRAWDILFMLHSMDYVNRSDFNHPLIVIVGFAAAWLAITGLWLLFRTGWRSDFKKRKRPAHIHHEHVAGSHVRLGALSPEDRTVC